MNVTRRTLLGVPLLAAVAPASLAKSAEAPERIAKGRFDATVESLKTYDAPAWFLGEPNGQVAITSLGLATESGQRSVRGVRMLGVSRPLKYQHTEGALVVELPDTLPARHASVLKISLGNASGKART